MNSLNKVVLSFFISQWSLTVIADPSSPDETQVQKQLETIRNLNKVVFTLTGLPATPAMVKSVSSGEKTLEDVVDSLKVSPQFVEKFAEYYTRALGITAPFALSTIKDPTTNLTLTGAALEGSVTVNLLVTDYDNEAKVNTLSSDLSTKKFHRLRSNRGATVCNGKRYERIYTVGSLNNGNAVNTIKEAATKGTIGGVAIAASLKQAYIPVYNKLMETQICDCAHITEVVPYWSKEPIAACRGITQDNYCGSNLADCFSEIEDLAGSRDPLRQSMRESFAMEPGMMIAKIVSEDHNFDEVLTSTKGVANPTMLYATKKFWKLWKGVLPPGSYPDLDVEKVENKIDVNNRNYQWVERGKLHAGVLTTVALHRVTNGWRAKANRVMGAFMCKAFKVPDGVKVVPSEEAELIRMPYCQACHATLEPLSQFFGRWPNLGNDSNFYYDPTNSVSSVGSLSGKEGADTLGLGSIMTSLPDYNECAVKRAFEFAVGREMNEYEAKTILPAYTEKFVDSGKKLWPIIRAFVLSTTQSGEE